MSLLLAVQGPNVSGSGASAVKFADAGTALEIFTGSGFSAVKFADAGVGSVQDNTGSGFSVVPLVDDGVGTVVNPRVIISGGGPPPPRRGTTKRKQKDRPLLWQPWTPEPEVPQVISPERAPEIRRLPLDPVGPLLDPILAPAAARQRAREADAAFHAAHDVAALGYSILVCSSSGRGRVIPAEMMSVLRQLATN